MAFFLWEELDLLVMALLLPKFLVLILLFIFIIIALLMAMLALVILLSFVRLGAIRGDVAFFSTIVACFVLDIFPWPEHSSFRVKVVTLLVYLIVQACELSHHESKFSIIFIIG